MAPSFYLGNRFQVMDRQKSCLLASPLLPFKQGFIVHEKARWKEAENVQQLCLLQTHPLLIH